MKNIRISIRTRLLLYFLFATLLPLMVLAITSTFIIQTGMRESALYITSSADYIKQVLETTENNISFLIFKIALVASLASIALSLIFSRLTTEPILEIANITKLIEEGDFSKRLNIKTTDEIAYLAKSFDSMSEALQKRKEAEVARENLVSTITHDLKVPLLASVRTLEYLLQGSYGELGERQKFITGKLLKNNNDLLAMVNIIVDTHKYEAGKYLPNKQVVNINSLIWECINELEPLAKEKEHLIHFYEIQQRVEIQVDAREIKRVILNLLSNAIKYTPNNGNIDINLHLYEREIIISVKDDGPGICEEMQKNIFDKYSSTPDSLKKVGTGLGLYLSRHIAEAHNGKIYLESEVNKGCNFYFSLPC